MQDTGYPANNLYRISAILPDIAVENKKKFGAIPYYAFGAQIPPSHLIIKGVAFLYAYFNFG